MGLVESMLPAGPEFGRYSTTVGTGPQRQSSRAASRTQPEGDATVYIGSSAPAIEESPASTTGDRIERYVVLEEVGRGAMGRVARAYDPKLQREVALKEVHGGGLDEEGLRRLVAEARAMARLSHPNVVAVYDVVERSDGGLVLAMEYVDGKSLHAWLRAQERPWREVMACFLQAGRGLAAAHHAGLLHRDFKPTNVLVGRDGVVKVTDFGLAKRLSDVSTPVPSSSSSSSDLAAVFSEELTAAGMVLGTPRYMAPEQHLGQALGPATDQYAFCLALWEAMCGSPPFVEPGYRELAKAKLAGPPRWPEPEIPRRIAEAIVRGLGPEAESRWPSMDALLEVLAWDPTRRRRDWWLGGAVVALAAMGTLGWHAWTASLAERCSGARDRLTAAWGPERRATVEDAILGVDVAFAPGVWERTSTALDHYAEDWVRAHDEACEATTVRGVQSAEVMDLRMTCLDRARVDLQAVTAELADADGEVISNAHRLTGGLPSLSRCADVEALSSGVEASAPHEREAVEIIRAQLAEVRAQLEAGRYREAASTVQAAARAIEPLEYGPIRTEVALLEGRTLLESGEYRAAEATLRRALESAARWGQWDLMAHATSQLLYVVGAKQQRYEPALQLEGLARGLTHDDPETRGTLLHDLGSVYYAAGELAKAEAMEREALALRTETLGPEHPEVASTRNNLGNTLVEAGRLDEARRMYEEALTVAEASLGPTHPDVAIVLYNLAIILQQEGKLDEAEAMSRRALGLWEAALGSEHPDVARALASLGVIMAVQGRFADGEPLQRRALAIREARLGPGHPDVGSSYSNLATNLAMQGRYAEAVECFRRSLEIQERVLGKDHYEVATARINLGIVMTYAGRPEDAEPVLREGIEASEAVLGADHPDVALARLNLASTMMMMNEPRRAELEARPAIAVLESKLPSDNPNLAIGKLTLGVILQEQGRLPEAELELRRALEIAEPVFDADHPLVNAIRQNLGVCALGQGRVDEALALAEQVWARRQRDDVPPEYQGETAFLLARARLEAGGAAALPDARRLAKRALEAFERASEGFAGEAEEIRRWLADHPARGSGHTGSG